MRVSVDEPVAEALCRQRGIYEKVFPSVPTFDRAALNQAYADGLLTDADMEAILVEVRRTGRVRGSRSAARA